MEGGSTEAFCPEVVGEWRMSRDPERFVERRAGFSELEGPSPEVDVMLKEADLSPEALLACDEEVEVQRAPELGLEELRAHFPDLTAEAFEELVDAELLTYLQEHLEEFILGEELEGSNQLDFLRELRDEQGESLHAQVRKLVGGVSRPKGADSLLDQLVTHIAAFIKAFEVRLLKKLKRADREAQLSHLMEQSKSGKKQLPLSGRSIKIKRGEVEEEEDEPEIDDGPPKP